MNKIVKGPAFKETKLGSDLSTLKEMNDIAKETESNYSSDSN